MAKLDLDFFEKVIIQQCLKKESTYISSIIDYLDKELFKDPDIASIVNIIKDFYLERSTIPTLTELATRITTSSLRESLQNVIGHVKKLDKDYNEDELIANTEIFLKQRKFGKLMETTIDKKVSNKEYSIDEFQTESEKIHSICLIDDLGLDYFEDIYVVKEYLQKTDNLLSTGYKGLDDAFGGGFQAEGKAIYDIGGETNVGKAQPVNLNILTPLGMKRFGDLKVGDEVFGKNGKPIKITHIHPQGIKKTYKVKFMDGRETLCCPEHLWTVWNSTKMRYETMDTETIKFKIENYVVYKNRIQVPLCNSVEFNKDKEFLIHPYVMGCLLGDGGLTQKYANFTNFDKECLSKFTKLVEPLNIQLSGSRKTGLTRIDRDQPDNNLRKELLRYGLVGKSSSTKFIPDDYLFASVEDRFALLSGFIDTDGFIGKNSSIEILLKNKLMVDQLAFIIRSLGGTAKTSIRCKPYKGELREYHVVRIRFPHHLKEKLQLISRKHTRLFEFGKNKKQTIHNSILSIEESGEEESMCITVDSQDHLYLTNDFIVTHNSICLANIVVNVLMQNKRVVIISPEMSEMRYAKRISGILTGIAIDTLKDDMDNFQERIDEFKKKYESRLIVKEVPTKGVSAKNVLGYLTKLKNRKGFIPSLICIDGHALLKSSINQGSVHANIQHIVQECRGLSYAFPAPVLTVAQLNRTAHKTNNPGLDSVSGSWDSLSDFDGHVNIWQTDEDREANIIRYGGKKVRDGAKGAEGFLNIDYDTLKLSEDNSMLDDYASADSSKKTLNELLDFDKLMGGD